MSKDKALAAKLREVSGLGDGNMRAHADVIRQWTAEAATRLEALQAQPVGEDRLIEIANRAVKENLNPDGTTKYRSAQGYACALSALRLAALTASPPVVEREAKPSHLSVIPVRGHPEKHAVFDAIMGDAIAVCPDEIAAQRVFDALTNADAILALTPVEGVGEEDARLLKGSASAEQMYADMYPEHAATIARIIDAYNFDTPSDRARAHEVARAMGGHPRATPVAQGDEVRDALEPFVAEWRSAGADHLADDMLWSDANAVEHVGMMLTVGDFRRLATLTKGARDAG